jgi:hypothetical protein
MAPGEVASEEPTALKFDHAAHAAMEKPVAVEECKTCHGADPAGALAQPAKRGHQPCLAAGCHAEDFLSVGARTKKDSPKRYKKAARFCAGCHKSRSGVAPSPFIKAKADNLYAERGPTDQKPGHYVEMDHLAHVGRTKCSTCHVVDAKTFVLSTSGPGHSECASCHEDNEKVTMPQCGSCHNRGVASDYFVARKADSDVRSCGSSRYRELSKKRKRNVPCFKHEHEGHRFRKEGEAVECGDCHFMFESAKYAGHSYQSLRDVKKAPLMDNNRDRAHQKCGASGCHRSEVNDSAGTGRCSMCHSSKAIIGNLLEE